MSAGNLGQLEWSVRARLDTLDRDLAQGEQKLERFRRNAERPINVGGSAAPGTSASASSAAAAVERRQTSASERLAKLHEERVRSAELELRLSETRNRQQQAAILRGQAERPGIDELQRTRLLTRANRAESGGQLLGWFQRFIALEGVRIGSAIATGYAQYGQSSTLAGNDPAAQLKAQLELRQKLISAAPFGVGELAALNDYRDLTVVQATTNLSEAQERQTAQAGTSYEFYRQLAFRNLQASTPNQYEQQRQAAEKNFDDSRIAIEKNRRDSTAAAVDLYHKTRIDAIAKAEALGYTEADLQGANAPVFFPRGPLDASRGGELAQAYIEYQASAGALGASAGNASRATQKPLAESQSARQFELGKANAEFITGIYGTRATTQSNLAAASGNLFGASLAQIKNETSAGAEGNLDAFERVRALTVGASRIFRLLGEAGISMTREAVNLEAQSTALGLRTDGSYLAANLSTIEANREEQQYQLGRQFGGIRNIPFVGNALFNSLGGGRLSQAIDTQAQKENTAATVEETRRVLGLQGSIAALNLSIQRQPLQASLATLQYNYAAATAGVTNPAELNRQFQLLSSQSALTTQQYQDQVSLNSSSLQSSIEVNKLRAQYKDKSARAREIRRQAELNAKQFQNKGDYANARLAIQEGQSAEDALAAEFRRESFGSSTGAYGYFLGPGIPGGRQFYEAPSAGRAAAQRERAALGNEVNQYGAAPTIGGGSLSSQMAQIIGLLHPLIGAIVGVN